MKLRALLDRVFPERQIYHRSHGQVHFISVSRRAQILLIGGTLAFLSWVAFASVNVVFKEQIITAKDQKFSTMEQSYGTRVSDLQKAIDELNAALVLSQQRFEEATIEMERRQDQVERVREQQDAYLERRDALRTALAGAWFGSLQTAASGGSAVPMHIDRREVSERVSRPTRIDGLAQFAGLDGIVTSIAERRGRTVPLPRATVGRLDGLEARAVALKKRQMDSLIALEAFATDEIAELEAILDVTKVSRDTLVARVAEDAVGMGGPFVGMDEADFDETLQFADLFDKKVFRVREALQRLMTLQAAVEALPVARPVDEFRLTSGFGPRRDPFTRRAAYHYGLDFAGPRGTPVMATGNGTVTIAGPFGAYGKMVEIDHGNGFKTRYGHLRKVDVKRGQTVELRQKIGEMGSTGRSTATHLHYEVRYDGDEKDPMKFLEAGRYVFKG